MFIVRAPNPHSAGSAASENWRDKNYSAPENEQGVIQWMTLSAREVAWSVIVNFQSSGGGKLKGARRLSRVREEFEEESQRRNQL